MRPPDRKNGAPQAAALRAADELTTWARDYAAALEPFASHEIAAVGHLAAIIDARLARKAAGDAA